MMLSQPLITSPANGCRVCHLDPCACWYIAQLAPTGKLAYLREAARRNFNKPLPHLDVVRDGDRGRAPSGLSCPCPRCYSLRMASWEVTGS